MKKHYNIIREKVLHFYQKYMILMGIAGHSIFIFQIYEMINQKSSLNVSLSGFCISFLSIISWLIYGVLKGDSVLIKVNVFGVCFSVPCIVVILVLR